MKINLTDCVITAFLWFFLLFVLNPAVVSLLPPPSDFGTMGRTVLIFGNGIYLYLFFRGALLALLTSPAMIFYLLRNDSDQYESVILSVAIPVVSLLLLLGLSYTVALSWQFFIPELAGLLVAAPLSGLAWKRIIGKIFPDGGKFDLKKWAESGKH